MDIQVLKTVAMIQGGLVLGVCMMIFYFYSRYGVRFSATQFHVLTISLSYMLLILATIISVSRAYYEWGDVWFWIVGTGYLIGDISLFIMFRTQVRKHFGTSKKIKL